ncbi:preprotein translocase subunit SecG [Candidatus Curtissbacteria bacterium RIFCSPHIGHO2_01_FULL_41_44]|uniref:Protein-export membrane protein SecG n=1 Tax=Candidatus Curtissbacteria bacterium RIFCSPLOWO2_01_FULL_42_50 TaxID=1797730 RepID=A0A1F5H4D3_9BACT|nr:MAG: preprotein translocase subunit SecG [Candidatus Curtissbacteria bacterium RIFCSPHIGHO2_01_FULL_41_44]OGD93225.1 MAG: preprotein translocase subunit SecG [Candidatus Curtissbacteria bacterium RIFCSPHIGHO2_02_FULL_42_58]OGD96865.1 MAG: preprotein translocase subunit SecG [Candidatus Curtissbacteria bacterium RIFCSPHIGHO2_12_FULL_42_33]OGD98929.1 MAG: preprotein translocase subunit SecG [Candidatus Curtissbacteria bacterium RIFCSPLOWO2_01_FULL_42_50]OGE03473.1 MAG: preprotein translocase s
MKNILLLAQIAVSITLIVVILLQAKGAGLSSVFGGQGTFYRSKRGIEKLFFFLTIFLALLFLIFSVAGVTL